MQAARRPCGYRQHPRRLVAGALALAALHVALGPRPARAQLVAESVQRAAEPAQRAAFVLRFGPPPADLTSAPATLRRRVTLHLHDTTIERALAALRVQVALSLTYSRNVVPLGRRISVDVDSVSVLDALSAVLGDTGVELWVSTSGRMALVPAERPAPASSTVAASAGASADDLEAAAAVAGSVVDSAGRRPLANVQVAVVGTRFGAVTNDNGRYTITGVPAGTHAVRAIRIGYAPETRQVTVVDGQTATADFALVAQAVQLETIVAVGYGTQSTRNVTGAVTNVDMEKVQAQAVEGVDKALAGQVPGVQVLQSNGAPGGGPQIQIRGVGAIGAGSQPLFVVDGYPLSSGGAELRNPLNDIPPGDIASISVLKDASSAAIYGSRAANGVVVITTKSGRNQAPNVRLDYAAGVQTVPSRFLPDVLNAQEFATYMKELNEDNVRFNLKREPTTADIPVEYQNPAQYASTGTDWLGLITRSAPTHNLNLSVSGGTSNIAGYLSGGFLRELGTVLGTDFTRSSLRASVSADPSRKLRVGLNLAPTYEIRNLPVQGGAGRGENGSPAAAAIASPLLSPFLADGSWRAMIQSPGNLNLPNPLMYLKQYRNIYRNLRGLGTAFVEYRPLAGLTLKSQASTDYSEQQNSNYRPSTLGVQFSAPPRIPVANYIESNYVNWLTEQTATYDRTLGGGHHLQLLGGFSVQAQRQIGGTFNGTNYPNDDIQTLNAAALITGSTDAQRWGLISYLSRLNYDFGDGKYLVSAAIRRDGSSRFAPQNRWGVFPSASVGWRVSEESFFKQLSWLSDLKLRAAYGQTGNNDLGNYSYVGQVGINDYLLNGTLASGRTLNTLGNPDLGWEKTKEVDVGLDLALFNNRVSFTADAYNGITHDLLLNVEIPNSSGFATVTKNTGRVRNRGLELGLHTINVSRGAFQWTSDLNVAMNRSLVLALGSNNAPIRSGASGEASPTHITMVGKPVGMFYGYVFQGLYQDSADIARSGAFPGAIPGNIKYKDINGDGTITAISDFDIIGNPYPDATFGLNNSVKLGRWDLSVVMTGQLGGDRMEGFFEYLHNIDGVFNVTRDVINRWRSPQQPGDGKHPTTAGVSRGRVLYRDVSTLWVHDATNLNVRNVTLRYRLPDRIARGRIHDANVYAGVQNAALLSNYPMNPEVTNYNRQTGALTPGYDAVAYPLARTFTIGTQFGF
jgi:TonB-linked SusC/RagA family outer membrane protein